MGLTWLQKKKTATLESVLVKAGLEGKLLIVQSEIDANLLMAANNLYDVTVTHLGEVNTYMVLNADVVIFTKDSVAAVGDRFEVKSETPKTEKTEKKEKTVAKPAAKAKTPKKSTSKAKKA